MTATAKMRHCLIALGGPQRRHQIDHMPAPRPMAGRKNAARRRASPEELVIPRRIRFYGLRALGLTTVPLQGTRFPGLALKLTCIKLEQIAIQLIHHRFTWALP
jgi:hypothetical protein